MLLLLLPPLLLLLQLSDKAEQLHTCQLKACSSSTELCVAKLALQHAETPCACFGTT
jgi:hypothetical protein